jgi:MFS family permease
MKLSIVEGGLTVLYGTWTSGAVLAGYLLALGASPSQLAMAASIPMLAQVISPFAAWVLSIYPNPRGLCTWAAFVGRSVFIIPAILPFFIPYGETPSEAAINYVLLLIAVSSLFNAAIGAVWVTWMGAVVPPKERGHYFGKRNGIHALIGLVASLIGGVLLDKVFTPLNHTIIFIFATASAYFATRLFKIHWQPASLGRQMKLVDTFTVPLRDANFRRFLVFSLYWQFAVFTGAVFVFPFFISHLDLTYTQIAIYQAIAAITTLVLGPIWGRLADKVGNKAVLTVSMSIAAVILPGCWLIARPGDPTMAWISGFVDGLAWSAINAAIFNLALSTAEPGQRSAYIGMHMMAVGIAGFIGGALAGPVLEAIKSYDLHIWGYHWSGYHWIFTISIILRIGALFLLRRVTESQSWRTRDLLRLMVSRQAQMWKGAGFFWR